MAEPTVLVKLQTVEWPARSIDKATGVLCPAFY